MPLPMPFHPGDLVVVVAQSPRERFWGRILGLETAGIALRGLDLSPWEEVLSLVRTGQADQVALSTRFIPMHRIRRIAYDGETMWEKGIDPCTGPGKRASDIQDQDI